MDRVEIFRSILNLFAPGTLLALGAGHRGFSIAARDLGWAVTAVDARKERTPGAPGITWVEHDVRDYDFEEFDIDSVLGLLYHLELPDQLALLDRCSFQRLRSRKSVRAALTMADVVEPLTRRFRRRANSELKS